ncbi:ribosomal RNA small subunit methyltransferase A [Candidatus Micrarchaeota archaeon]|nr:MAG: ribosomal RNA small subunit methyltransferase A [Candidatus Micrarchaeota archaeon]
MKAHAKRLGQNFLSDVRVLNREVDYAKPDSKLVLEVGAGDGRLTRLLASRAKKVVAVEVDKRLVQRLLPLLVEFENLEIIHADFLELDLKGKHFDLVISNVPYSISAPLLFKLTGMNFTRAVLCLQKEFVDRMLAKPSDRKRSRLSVMSQLHFDIWGLEKVPHRAFKPSPKVDSAIIELRKKNFTATEFQANFINALFQHKKKRVANSLVDSAHMFGRSKQEVKKVANSLSLADERAFRLTNEQILKLALDFRDALN